MANPLLKQRTTIAVAAESVEGTAESIVSNDAKYLVYDVSFKVEPNLIKRNLSSPYFGKKASLIANKIARISFKTEVVGSGTADAEPAWAIFLKACGFDPSVNAGTSVQFDPVTTAAYGAATGNVALTIWVYEDGKVKKAKGCRGTGKLMAKAGELAYFEWEFTGVYYEVADVTFPALASGYDANVPPLVESATFAFHGLSSGVVLVDNVEIDIGNVISPRNDVTAVSGIRSFFISDRNVVGSIDPEEMLEATWGGSGSELARLIAGTTGAFSLTIGSVTGNKFQVLAPAATVQVVGVDEIDRESIRANTVNLEFNVPLQESATDHEIRFVTL